MTGMPPDLGMDDREPARRAPTPHAAPSSSPACWLPLHGSMRLLKVFPARAPGTLDLGCKWLNSSRCRRFASGAEGAKSV
jgi:hypothetical protein